MKYLTKDILAQVSRDGARIGFARQIGGDLIERLPDGANFPVLASILHDRVQGQRGYHHMRTIIAVSPKETWQIDMCLDTFSSLPEMEEEVEV